MNTSIPAGLQFPDAYKSDNGRSWTVAFLILDTQIRRQVAEPCSGEEQSEHQNSKHSTTEVPVSVACLLAENIIPFIVPAMMMATMTGIAFAAPFPNAVRPNVYNPIEWLITIKHIIRFIPERLHLTAASLRPPALRCKPYWSKDKRRSPTVYRQLQPLRDSYIWETASETFHRLLSSLLQKQ